MPRHWLVQWFVVFGAWLLIAGLVVSALPRLLGGQTTYRETPLQWAADRPRPECGFTWGTSQHKQPSPKGFGFVP